MKKLFAILTLLITSFTAFGITRKALIVNDSVVFSETQYDEVVPEIQFNGKTIVTGRTGDEYDVQIDETFIDHITEGSTFTAEDITFSCIKTESGHLVLSFVEQDIGYVLYIEH